MSEKKLARWYFGGLASAGAACCTHPLDLLKVNKNIACLILNLPKSYYHFFRKLTIKFVNEIGVLVVYTKI